MLKSMLRQLKKLFFESDEFVIIALETLLNQAESCYETLYSADIE